MDSGWNRDFLSYCFLGCLGICWLGVLFLDLFLNTVQSLKYLLETLGVRSIGITSYVSGCEERPLLSTQSCLWLELKVDLELHKLIVNLVPFTVEQVWLGDTNLSIWEAGVGYF